MAAAQNLAAEFLSWLGSGLNPSLPFAAGIAFLVIAGTAAFLAMLRQLLPEVVHDLVAAPLIEELTCRIFLVGCVMTIHWPCAAPQTVILCGALFALGHAPTAIATGDLLRVLDGLIVGVLSTIVCLVLVRLFMSTGSQEEWIAAYLALAFMHAGYNFWALVLRGSPIFAIALRAGGVLLTIATWFAWMPRLV